MKLVDLHDRHQTGRNEYSLELRDPTFCGVLMSTRFRIAVVIYGMVNAVIFGTGVVLVLSIPEISEAWPYLIPRVVFFSFIAAVPIAWVIASRMRARSRRNR